jgi:hypothetical protein
MIKWMRPSGSIIETGEGENIVKFAEIWGWVCANESLAVPDDELSMFTTKDEVEAYILKKTGVDIDKRGSLDTVKDKARAVLNGNSE